MAKVILTLPYYALKDVITIIRAGLVSCDVDPTISERTRRSLLQWCKDESRFVSNVQIPETDERITTEKSVSFIRSSPCTDVYDIAKEMSVDVKDVNDALIEQWSKKVISDRGCSMLDMVCACALYSAGRELVSLVESFAPTTDEDHFYHEYEKVKFLVTIERDILDVQVNTEICFEVGS